MPKVSVLIPLYKANNFIAETLDSVLNQKFTDFEIIVVDDCGNDGSLEIVESYRQKDRRIKVLNNDANHGIAYTRNRGLDECAGEYIALLDDDDLMIGERLDKQVRFLDEHTDIGAVGGNAQWIDSEGKILRGTIDVEKNPLEIKMFLLFRNILNNSEMTFRKSVVDENEIRYSENCYGMEDFKFWIDFSKISSITNISDLILKKRCLSNNETSKVRKWFSKERKEKFFFLQKYSLEKSGFTISQKDEAVLKEYMGEEHLAFSTYKEMANLSLFFDDLLQQAKEMQLDFYNCMGNWFFDLLAWQNRNIHRDNFRKVMNIDEKEYLRLRCTELEKYIEELLEGKKWLEKHCEEQDIYIKELLEGKGWLEEHSKEQDIYIKELLEGKGWLEEHSKEQDIYKRAARRQELARGTVEKNEEIVLSEN